MKAIRQRLLVLAALTVLGLLVSFPLFSKDSIIFYIDRSLFVVFVFPLSILLLTLFIREYKKYIFAQLIIENKIINIQAVKTEQKSEKVSTTCSPIQDAEIFISCFGILIGSRVIKFNIDGIHLKKVEIGNDFICIVYGKDENNDTIRLLHGVIDKQELQSIVNRFRFETGIIPTIVD